MRDALHQAAVADEHIGQVVDDREAGAVELGGQQALGQRHADRVGEALAERAGGGLHARRDADLGMAGRLRVQLAEVLQLLHRQLVAGQMQQRVQQHRAVAVGQHEAVAVEPARVGRIVAQVPATRAPRAISAMPIGMPGWPELAFWTASMASTRMASAMRAVFMSGFGVVAPLKRSLDVIARRRESRGFYRSASRTALGSTHFAIIESFSDLGPPRPECRSRGRSSAVGDARGEPSTVRRATWRRNLAGFAAFVRRLPGPPAGLGQPAGHLR